MSTSRYQEGQRWTFQTSVQEFEDTLVIGTVNEAHPEWGMDDETYEVYVRYSEAAKPAIPSDYDGTVLSLNAEGLDRSVAELVEENMKLPWWWIYGRQFESTDDAPPGRGVLSTERVCDDLPHVFASARQFAERMRARKDALDQHREKFASRTEKPAPRTVAESWQRIEAWYDEHAFSISGVLADGASEEQIAAFEKEIGAQLPDDFKESVRVHDGGNWWVPWRHGDLLSLSRIIEQWKMYSEWQAKGDYATDDWQADEIEGPIKPVFWNKQRIYISDNSGDHLTLDLDPPEDGAYGQILDHSHEVGPTEVVAKGWAEFLRGLVNDLESGVYVYIEADGSVERVDEVERELTEGG